MIMKSNGYKKLNIDLGKGKRMEKTHFKLGENENRKVSQNPFQICEKIQIKYYSMVKTKEMFA